MIEPTGSLRAAREAMPHHQQMIDAQAMCVPCKLCGCAALITDAGDGAGYYIGCENSGAFRPGTGCMISDQRLGGWAYNVMEWWNRLHQPAPPTEATEARAREVAHRIIMEFRPTGWQAKEDEIYRLLLGNFAPTEATPPHDGLRNDDCAHCGAANFPDVLNEKGPDKVHPYRIRCKKCGISTAWHGDFRAASAAWTRRPCQERAMTPEEAREVGRIEGLEEATKVALEESQNSAQFAGWRVGAKTILNRIRALANG